LTHFRRTALPIVALGAALALAISAAAYADNDKRDDIDPSRVQQGFDASPIPKEKLNLKGKDPYLVGLGSYIVNGAADCNACHTFPRFLRPGHTPANTPPGNATHNLASLGSNPNYGNPYLDGPEQPLNGQLKANTNADTEPQYIIGHTSNGAPIYKYNHFLAGGRCFGFFMSRNITPDDSGKPRGLTEAEFIKVMRQGKDISCDPARPDLAIYGGAKDPVCSTPEGRGSGTSFNPGVLQVMSWPTYHSMTDTDLKAVYAYLSALPQSKACNTVDDGCAGFFGAAATMGVPFTLPDGTKTVVPAVGANQYAYQNTDDCPKNGNNSSPPQ
jgi:hypothetical protein